MSTAVCEACKEESNDCFPLSANLPNVMVCEVCVNNLVDYVEVAVEVIRQTYAKVLSELCGQHEL